jgi:hypothetical protein
MFAAAGLPVDVTSDTSVDSSANTITLASTDSTGKKLLVFWVG